MRIRADIWLLSLACVCMLLAALLHLAGYGGLHQLLEALPLRAQPLDTLRAIWLLHSVNLLAGSALCAASALWPQRYGRGSRLLLALWMGSNAAVLWGLLGAFIGAWLPLAAAVAAACSAFVRTPAPA
jgi:hypothetical protein